MWINNLPLRQMTSIQQKLLAVSKRKLLEFQHYGIALCCSLSMPSGKQIKPQCTPACTSLVQCTRVWFTVEDYEPTGAPEVCIRTTGNGLTVILACLAGGLKLPH